jgi:hypothetical protein
MKLALTARRIDMGNTMRIDMGNTFCALRRPATHFLREAELLHTSSQTPSIGPLGACDEVCSSSCGTGEISLQTIEVLPMCVLKVLPMSMRATHPSPLPEERESTETAMENSALRLQTPLLCLSFRRQTTTKLDRIIKTWTNVSPSPGGEGWGEGEGGTRSPGRLRF